MEHDLIVLGLVAAAAFVAGFALSNKIHSLIAASVSGVQKVAALPGEALVAIDAKLAALAKQIEGSTNALAGHVNAQVAAIVPGVVAAVAVPTVPAVPAVVAAPAA